MSTEIQKLEAEIAERVTKLETLRKNSARTEVQNYSLQTLNGSTTLKDLFGDKHLLMAIHNMGQGCRYCTLWADGFNGLLPHLESRLAVVVLSKDAPEVQRQFALSRGWKFRMASHCGGAYMKEQSVGNDASNMPGVVVYERSGDKIYKKNASVFGPGDVFCAHWHLLSLAGLGTQDWTPQFQYWKRPAEMDDGGKNLS